MRKGRQKAQISLNKALDDLLGPDEDDVEESPASRSTNQRLSSPQKKEASRNLPKKGGLTSSTSNKDFYKNLSAIAGQDINEDVDDKEDENLHISANDAAKVANSLANMDDLESDLFGSFGSKKPSTADSSKPPPKINKKTSSFSDFDEDDPLAGLGLSDDEDILSQKIKLKKREPVTRKLSHSSSKGKVDPNINNTTESPRNESLGKSTSFEKDDPFLATDPRPRSGSVDRKFRRLNSWDDPSFGTHSASESDLTPRSRSNSGSQSKHERKGSNRKKKVNPSSPNMDGSAHNNEDAVDTPSKEDKPEYKQNTEKIGKSTKAKVRDDMFDDEDDLPGLGEDKPEQEMTKNVATKVKKDDEGDSTRKATAALSDLLGGKSKQGTTNARKPTFLEQMMSKSTNQDTLPLEADSPMTTPRDRDVLFGGYSPSLGAGPKDRPTTAPNKRSVRFADELGLDHDFDASFSESRPVSAPESGRSQKEAVGGRTLRRRSVERSFSFEDESTDVDVSMEMKGRRSPVTKTANSNRSQKADNAKKEANTMESRSSENTEQVGKQRRNLQRSRRTEPSFGATEADYEKSKDDWLGLEDGGSFVEATPNTSSADKNRAATSKDVGKSHEALADDWLGLGDNQSEVTKETKPDIGSQSQTNETEKNPPVQADKESKRATDESKAISSNPAQDDDSLFPWDLAKPMTKQQQGRREKPKQQLSATLVHSGGENSASRTSQFPKDAPALDQPSKKPMSHSTPKSAVGNTDTSKVDYDPTTPVLRSEEQRTVGETRRFSSLEQTNRDAFQNAQNAAQNAPLNSVGDSFAAQVAAAQRILSTAVPNHETLLGNMSLNERQIDTVSIERIIQQKKLEEYAVERSHSEQRREGLESELRNLQAKVNAAEENKLKKNLELMKKIDELESKIRKYELEVEHWKSTQNATQKRHDDEIKAMENSFKTRYKILEDTYERREAQLKEEHKYNLNNLNEKLQAAEVEKQETAAFHRRKLELVEKDKNSDIERIREIHRRAMEESKRDYEDQLDRLRLLKEQEVAAATSMFSQTKSLQSLIHQVHSSASEVDQLQKRIDFSHRTGLGERELALKARDEYLTSMQERLHQQETETIEERTRLQGLIAKLEVQLRQQSRQQDQEKWKLVQDENRITSMQTAFETERRETLEQLDRERQLVDKAREELSKDQKQIMSECHAERQRVNTERSQLEIAKSKFNRNNLEQEFAVLKEREAKIVTEEQRLERERRSLEQSFEAVKNEKEKLVEFAKKIQEKSKQIEQYSQEASKMQLEGAESLDYAEKMKAEAYGMSSALEDKTTWIQQQENILQEEKISLEKQLMKFEREKENSKCFNCRRASSIHPAIPHIPNQNSDNRSQYGSSESPTPSNTDQSTWSEEETRASEARISKQRATNQQSHHAAPDLLLNSLDFNRKLRKWSSDREQDEQFFEKETQYLDKIQQKRTRQSRK